MPAVVSEISVVRAPSHSQATGIRPHAGADQASGSFSELLDGSEAPEAIAPASTSKPLESTRTEAAPAESGPAVAAPQEGKTDETEAPAKTAEGTDAPNVPAEIALVIAAAGQQRPAIQGKEDKTGQPAEVASPDEAVSDETASDADAEADAPLQTDAAAGTADAPDVQTVAQPAPAPTPASAPVATPVSAPVPTVAPVLADATTAVATESAVTEAIPVAGAVASDAKAVIPSAVKTAVPPTVKAGASETPAGAIPDLTPPPVSNDGAAQTEQAIVAKTETLSDGKAATPDVSTTTTETEAGQKSAARSTDTAAIAAKADAADTLGLKPGTTAAAQTPPDGAANSANLPPPPVTHAATPQVAQPSPHYQPVPGQPVPVAGLAVEIAANAHNGKNRFEIRLDPQELGRIDVQLHIDDEGQVTSHLRVERPETLDLLRRDAQSLERALQQAGLKTSDGGMQFSLRDQSFSQQQQGRDTPATARIVVPDEKLIPIETQRHYGRLAGTGSGVDIRI